ncbi:MAG: DUF4388 domain-containing protein [Calditrichaeota bacterium]|nr:DUF4388 domain-containing protein [Calditrichota bacterium]HQU71006.1 DUF4388 domain-containing protein [Calditrichia bacterium]
MALVGNLKDLKLANIIQINCNERNVAKVSVQGPDLSGAVFFARGAIIHAEYGPFEGERAVHEMLALDEGQFIVESGVEAPRQSITIPWNSIMLEGLRLLDERKVINAPIPQQMFDLLSGLRSVKNVFVLNYNGQVVEGKIEDGIHPLSLTFVWYKLKKMLNLFYSDMFQYILLRREKGYLFIFEFRPNLVVLETDHKVVAPEFTFMVKKVLKQINSVK